MNWPWHNGGVCPLVKYFLHPRKETVEKIIGLWYGFISSSFPSALFRKVVNHKQTWKWCICIFSFSYILTVTSWHSSNISYKLSTLPGQSVFSDHFPFAIKDCDHSLTHRLRRAALTPKEVRNSQPFPPRGLAENSIPCVLRLWLRIRP